MKRTINRTGPSQEVRETVRNRDHHRCILCGIPSGESHHRRPRGLGGTSLTWVNLPANLVTLCRRCHTEVESRREHYRELGFLIPFSSDEAEMIPLTYPDRYVWLYDDGSQKVIPRRRIP